MNTNKNSKHNLIKKHKTDKNFPINLNQKYSPLTNKRPKKMKPELNKKDGRNININKLVNQNNRPITKIKTPHKLKYNLNLLGIPKTIENITKINRKKINSKSNGKNNIQNNKKQANPFKNIKKINNIF